MRKEHNVQYTTLKDNHVTTMYRQWSTVEESWGYETFVWSLDAEGKRNHILHTTGSNSLVRALEEHNDLVFKLINGEPLEDNQNEN
jgi:hypothetical protein